MTEKTVAEHIVDFLERPRGPNMCLDCVGTPISPCLPPWPKARLILSRSVMKQIASHAADAYGRVTGQALGGVVALVSWVDELRYRGRECST